MHHAVTATELFEELLKRIISTGNNLRILPFISLKFTFRWLDHEIWYKENKRAGEEPVSHFDVLTTFSRRFLQFLYDL